MLDNTSGKDYVSLVRIPRKLFNIFVWFFSITVILYTFIDSLSDWHWESLGNTILIRTSVLMSLIVGWFFIISHIWRLVMFLYTRIFRQKIFNEAKAKAYQEIYQELGAWEKRRQEAKARGEDFDEPIPITIPDYNNPLDPNSINNPMP